MTRNGAASALFLFLIGCSPQEEPEPKPVVTVKVATAVREDVRTSVEAPAVVHPRQQANIAARITAGIRELLVRKGDSVGAGQVLARLESRDLLAQRAEAEATRHQAEVLADRRARLFEQGAIPEKDMLTAQTELATAKARLELVDAQLKFTELQSPFRGIVTEQFLYPGDMAQPSSPIFTVSDLGVAVARAQVPEPEAAAIQQGQHAAFVPADAPEESVEGRITVINRSVDTARRTVEVWCEIPNDRGRLLPGAYGELRIVTGTLPNSVVVPLAAVEFESGTKKGSVVVIDAQKVAHRKEVEGGKTFEDKVQIVSGLDGGEVVAIEGGYGLADGTAVQIAAPEGEKGEKKAEEEKASPGKEEKDAGKAKQKPKEKGEK